MGKKNKKNSKGSSVAAPNQDESQPMAVDEDEIVLAQNESFGPESGDESPPRAPKPKKRKTASSSSSSSSGSSSEGNRTGTGSSSSTDSGSSDAETSDGNKSVVLDDAIEPDNNGSSRGENEEPNAREAVAKEPIFKTLFITIPRVQEEEERYDPTAFSEDKNPHARRVNPGPPSTTSDFSGSAPLTPEQQEVKALTIEMLGLRDVEFEDHLLKMEGEKLIEIYADPSVGILADAGAYGPPNAGDPRSRDEKALCCAAALRADSMRMASLAAGFLPCDVLAKWHPNLRAPYLSYQMAKDEEEDVGYRVLPQDLRAAADVVTDKYVTFLDSLGRKLLLDAATPGPAAQVLHAAPTAIEQIMAFLGHSDRMPVGSLEWVRNFWKVVSKNPSALASTCPPLGQRPLVDRDAEGKGPTMPPGVPAYLVRPPAPATEAPQAGDGYTCPYLEACITGVDATTSCNSKTCPLRGLAIKDGDTIQVNKECWAYYPLGKVKQWANMETGPYDNRKNGKRTYVFYGKDQEWADVKETLQDLGFFEAINGSGVATLGALNWTKKALEARGLLTRRGEQPRFCMAGYTLGAANGVVLVDQCLYSGSERGFLNHGVPTEIVALLESDVTIKVQSGIHEEGRFVEMGIELQSYVDATLLALTQYPQPGVEPGRMQCNPTYVAIRLNSPAVPIVVHQDRREKRNSVSGASLSDRAFYINLAEADFSLPFDDWTSEMKMHAFCTMSLPFALMWKAATRAMELEMRSPKADALRYLRLLLSRLLNMPGVNGIGKTSLQRRPWNLVEFHSESESRHGVPLRAEWVLLDSCAANSVRHPLPAKKIFLKGHKFSYDLHNLDRDLVSFLRDFTGGHLTSLTWGMLLEYHFKMGAFSPHVCDKCGSPDHLAKDCKEERLLCLYPLCRSAYHILYVCPRMWIRCEKCHLYGHLASHHLDEDFIRMIENFRFCALFNRRTLSLHDCATFICEFEEDGLFMSLQDEQELRRVEVPFTDA